MKKLLYLFILLNLLKINTFAQNCQNPNARLERLKAPTISKKKLFEKVSEDLEFIQILPSDTIADIGSYDGQYPCIYSIFTDSVAFYLNDIMPDGFKTLDSLQKICSNFKGKPISNSFNVVIGNESSTDLPSKLFNKVIMRDALHHFSLMDQMLIDIKRILKHKGKLFLFEQLKLPNIVNENLCIGVMNKEVLLDLLTRNGFIKIREKYVKDDLIWLEFEVIQ